MLIVGEEIQLHYFDSFATALLSNWNVLPLLVWLIFIFCHLWTHLENLTFHADLPVLPHPPL